MNDNADLRGELEDILDEIAERLDDLRRRIRGDDVDDE